MKYALVLANSPTGLTLPIQEEEWGRVLQRVREAVEGDHEAKQSLEELVPGAWLVALDRTPRGLVRLCASIDGTEEKSSWGYRVLFLDEEPEGPAKTPVWLRFFPAFSRFWQGL